MTNEDKLKRWLADELSDSERKQFESTDEFEKINRLMNAVKNFKAPDYYINGELGKLNERVVDTRKISLYNKLSPVWRIAAIFILVLTIGYIAYNNFIGFPENQEWIAETGEVYLPDSSSVMLNADSKIRFSEIKWKKERNVELKGEAFFMVKKGSKFNVKTHQGTVTVLGTHFGVKDWDNYYEVICYEGSVKVFSNKKTTVLEPGSAYRVINGFDENFKVIDKSKPDWINGESSFKSVPLNFVLTELERQYKVQVKSNNIDLNQLFTGSFTNNNLEIALESIAIPVNLNYKISRNQTVIRLEEK